MVRVCDESLWLVCAVSVLSVCGEGKGVGVGSGGGGCGTVLALTASPASVQG